MKPTRKTRFFSFQFYFVHCGFYHLSTFLALVFPKIFLIFLNSSSFLYSSCYTFSLLFGTGLFFYCFWYEALRFCCSTTLVVVVVVVFTIVVVIVLLSWSSLSSLLWFKQLQYNFSTSSFIYLTHYAFIASTKCRRSSLSRFKLHL